MHKLNHYITYLGMPKHNFTLFDCFLFKERLLSGSCESTTHMMKVRTPTLQISAGGPTTSPFNISGAA